jgi:hypothetical protein
MAGYLSRFPLELRYVQYLPSSTGVVVLWDGQHPVCIAGTASIAEEVRSHCRGAKQPAPPAVTHFSYELAAQAEERARQVRRDLEAGGRPPMRPGAGAGE